MIQGSAAAAEAPICGPRGTIVDALIGDHHEIKVADGLGVRGRVFELFVSFAGSWTFVMTDRSGLACIMAAGHNWDWWLPAEQQPETQNP